MAAGKRKNKTVASGKNPLAFIDGVTSEVKRNDSRELVALMRDITGALSRPRHRQRQAHGEARQAQSR